MPEDDLEKQIDDIVEAIRETSEGSESGGVGKRAEEVLGVWGSS